MARLSPPAPSPGAPLQAREAELQEQLQAAQDSMATMQRLHQATQNQLFAMQARSEEEKAGGWAGWLAGRAGGWVGGRVFFGGGGGSCCRWCQLRGRGCGVVARPAKGRGNGGREARRLAWAAAGPTGAASELEMASAELERAQQRLVELERQRTTLAERKVRPPLLWPLPCGNRSGTRVLPCLRLPLIDLR
jgi:hypothetical protein